MDIDVLSYFVIPVDMICVAFLMWRVFSKNATLWGAARFIYVWVSLLTAYHGVIYILTLFSPQPNVLIQNTLHPFVILFIMNPLLIAIIHWRGGHLWK
jgi:hypothetical protein